LQEPQLDLGLKKATAGDHHIPDCLTINVSTYKAKHIMATRKFTRGAVWANSSLPGPPTRPRARLLDSRTSQTPEESHVQSLVLECLARIEEIGGQVEMIAPHVKGYENEDLMLRLAGQHTHEICAILRGLFQKDPSLCTQQVLERLRQLEAHPPIQASFRTRR
jgi:hypothetical protein